MISLISKQSGKIDFPITSRTVSQFQSRPNEVIIESGVAVISFGGQNPTDWTRDTLSFPVGKAVPQQNFLSGIATGGPASIWTSAPPINVAILQNPDPITAPVEVEGSNSAGVVVSTGNVSLTVPGFVTAAVGNIPDFGCAVDSATVAYSSQAGQPIVTFALAVFGKSTFLLRVAYTVHIVLGEPGIVVVGGGNAGNAQERL